MGPVLTYSRELALLAVNLSLVLSSRLCGFA